MKDTRPSIASSAARCSGSVFAGLRRAVARAGIADGQCRAITAIERFGSALNVNVHFHALVLDGVFRRPAPGAPPVFHPLPAPTGEEIARILEHIHGRRRGLLRRRGRPPEEPGAPDPVAEQMLLLAGYAAASIQECLATGPRAGHPVRRLRPAAAVVDGEKLRCARLEGFSLHANVALDARAREQLEHLCRYLLRPPLALDRLSESPNGQLTYQLPHPRRDGATHLLLDPLELIEKLCALIAPPRFHLLRFHGVLAPRARLRSEVVPLCRRDPEQCGGPQPPGPSAPETRPTPSCGAGGLSWAALMKRVFEIDVLLCPRCGGRRRIVAGLLDDVGVTFGIVGTVNETLTDQQMQDSGALVPFADGNTLTVSAPFHLEGVNKIPAKRAPSIGQHSDEILREGGYSADEIGGLRRSGVVA